MKALFTTAALTGALFINTAYATSAVAKCRTWVDLFSLNTEAGGCVDDGPREVAAALDRVGAQRVVAWCVTDESGSTCYDGGDASLDLILATADPVVFCKDDGGSGGKCWKKCGSATCRCSDVLGIGFTCFCFTGAGTQSDQDGGQQITGWGTVCNN